MNDQNYEYTTNDESLKLSLSILEKIQHFQILRSHGICSNFYFELRNATIRNTILSEKAEIWFFNSIKSITGVSDMCPIEGSFELYSMYSNKWDITNNPFAASRFNLLRELIDKANKDIELNDKKFMEWFVRQNAGYLG